jgi:hypothetical protein
VCILPHRIHAPPFARNDRWQESYSENGRYFALSAAAGIGVANGARVLKQPCQQSKFLACGHARFLRLTLIDICCGPPRDF